MKRASRSIGWLVTVLTVGTSPRASAAHQGAAPGAAGPVAVPEPLKAWIPWVLHGEGESGALPAARRARDDDRVCAWPARLSLALDDGGGTLQRRSGRSARRGAAKLAGNDEHWPLDVRVDGKPAARDRRRHAGAASSRPATTR